MSALVIKGGTLVDGTGAPSRVADVAIEGGTIVNIDAHIDSIYSIDATGLVVSPGFIDAHTHYDAQLHWDPTASPSSQHGVTSVVGGNCGFTLAPLHAEDGDFTRKMMARVEGMPLEALEAGLDWSWSTFSEFLQRLDGATAVNAGFMVGHCALRRFVLGEASDREASPSEIAQMKSVLHESLAAGGLGLSTSRSGTHMDGQGAPVPSRNASVEELLELCRVVGAHPGTTLEGIVQGCIDGFSPDEMNLLTNMSVAANRPVNWNILRVQSSNRDATEHQLALGPYARERGGRVVALTLPVHEEMNMSFGRFCAIWLLPGWMEILSLPTGEKINKLSDASVRRWMLEQAATSPLNRFAQFGNYLVGETISVANKGYEGRLLGEVASENGVEPFTMAVEIAIEDDFDTVWWPLPTDDSDEDWTYRREVWQREDVLLGGSDAGAHLDRMLGSSYPTRFLADCLRGRRLISLERAIELMTKKPAELFGLERRGTAQVGSFADLVMFDPMTVASQPARRVTDLPGGSMRLTAASDGIVHVFVNGVQTIKDQVEVGDLPGRVLRSGRDTHTVTATQAVR
jgi:N-acyl-D-aspartate/D-glutamate deacylase